jgi:hypothetical protein
MGDVGMKKLLVAAGISAMLIVSQTAAYADGAKTEDAPRVVDRVAEATKTPDTAVAPVKLENGVPVVAANSYNSRINAATQAPSFSPVCGYVLYMRGQDPSQCPEKASALPTIIGAGVVIGAIAVALDDSSESD